MQANVTVAVDRPELIALHTHTASWNRRKVKYFLEYRRLFPYANAAKRKKGQ
jgi:hypothetical protein